MLFCFDFNYCDYSINVNILFYHIPSFLFLVLFFLLCSFFHDGKKGRKLGLGR